MEQKESRRESYPPSTTSLPPAPANQMIRECLLFQPQTNVLNIGNETNSQADRGVRAKSDDWYAKQVSSMSIVEPQASFKGGANPSFPQRLYFMLQEIVGSRPDFAQYISWRAGGSAFTIHKPRQFAKVVLPHYFRRQSKFESFQRQLNNYAFKRISTETIGLTYCHDMLRQDQPERVRGIQLRKKTSPKPKANNLSEVYLAMLPKLLCSQLRTWQDFPHVEGVTGDEVLDEAVAQLTPIDFSADYWDPEIESLESDH